MIYFDSAATSLLKPKEVAQAVYNAILSLGNASRGTYEASLDASRLIFDTREKIAELFNVGNPLRVAFCSNATESLNTVINGLLCEKDHVITTVLEHNSVLRPLYRLAAKGMGLSIVKSDDFGNINPDDIEKQIGMRTKAVVCTHASNLTGNAVAIEKIGEICKKHGLLFIVDASQTAGILPVDMKKQNISALCFTGHKSLFGPQGTGGICLSEGVRVRPLTVGGSGISSYSKTQPEKMPAVLEAGTLNAHSIAGLNAGIDFINKTGIKSIYKKELLLARRFYNGVKNIKGVKTYGDFKTPGRVPIVTLNIADRFSGDVSSQLSESYSIAARAGAHCAPLMHEAFGTVSKGAVRFSFSCFNTEKEIDKGIKAVNRIAAESNC